MKPYLFLAAAMMCLLQTPYALVQDSELSQLFSTNTGLGWLQDLTSGCLQSLSRKRRVIGIPVGSNIEVRWGVNLPFNTYTLYTALLQVGVPVKFQMPDALLVGGSPFFKRSVSGEDEDLELDDNLDAILDSYVHWYQPRDDNQPEYHARSRRAARQERLAIYKYMETAFNKTGVDGRSCLLRALCEVAEAPFDQGIVGEMINTLLAASLAGRGDTEEERKEFDQFIIAELAGKLYGNCEKRYSKCTVAPLDLLPFAVHNVE